MSSLIGARIHVTGIVQGVGFRPFIFSLARQAQLAGWVKNTSAGVEIEVDGTPEQIEAFIREIKERPPAMAQIDGITVANRPVNGYNNFAIIQSEVIPGAYQPISADVSICPDCLGELFDPGDRRYRYPFINCTNCGPRFTIIRDIPYDRPNTTMADFPLCPECQAEYDDPLDRRFHAQPVACLVCGPQVWVEGKDDDPTILHAEGDAAIRQVQELLLEGKIVAIKGLGGFHLACDATNPAAVAELRQRKLRVDKPFALMFAGSHVIQQHCFLNPGEQSLLESTSRPILLLQRKPASTVAVEVAPAQNKLGVMLPYTPLHYLLFSEQDDLHPAQVLVMTSGNLSEEPIVTGNDEAREHLADLADAFLMHNRPIQTRCDDSVLAYFDEKKSIYPIRRSRGYAPYPVRLPWKSLPLLAVGGELKNTFCLAKDDYAFLSHHIGDMQNYETLVSFETGVRHFERLFKVQPQALAFDLHPDYMASHYARERARQDHIPAYAVLHHHAHIAAVMADNHLEGDETVLGIAFDGTGFGDDGAIWGGEFLVAGYNGYQRIAHLAYTPLPGGDAAIRKPARIALAQLWQAGLEWDSRLACVAALSDEERQVLRSQLELGINLPQTSSMGRLFDAVAALAGVRQVVNYEAQAAIELEALVDPYEHGSYPLEIVPYVEEFSDLNRKIEKYRIDPRSIIGAVCDDVYANFTQAQIAARFHNTLVNMILDIAILIRERYNISTVALSGGVWQNMTLLNKTDRQLKRAGFNVLTHQSVPANDGGLALGQAAIAAYHYRS
jgi:hydrogenase maturation protein HypF